MPEVLVQAEWITPTTGTTIIDREMIENLPTRDGNINEIVGIVPGVQFAEESFNSFTAGEISPPVVSISGSRYYDNNYTINGISNNNPLDPAFDSTTGAGKLPGHPQIHFLNSQIIDQITVYNSNIPAEFGGFTGGQIDVKTISPDNVSSGSIHYRTTEDSWTKFHIHPDHLDDFYNSKTTDKQPEFRKQAFGLNFNLPIGNDTGLVTAYEQQRSKIPLQHLDGYNTQTRRQENFFLKAEHYLPSGAELALTGLYSPTDNQYFLTETKGSDYSIEGHNLSFGLSYENQLAAGDLLSNLTYTSQQTRRDAAPNRLFWDASQPAIDWDSGREGGLGVLETGHKEISLSSDFTTNKLMLGKMDHQIKFGATATHSRQHYFRPLTNYLYYTSVVDSLIICDAGDPACINSEQYLSKRTAYLEADRTADISDYAGYIQNNIAWKRLEIFPGLRVSYDDYTNNVNLAPRLSLSLDLFGDRDTIFFGGRNRYYSGTLLTHALYSGYVTESQSRGTSGNGQDDWVTTSVIYSYGEDSVKTPYTDETTIGLIKQLLGGELKAQYLRKKSRDEFARHREVIDGRSVYTLNNFGKSEHQSIQLSWQRSWRHQQLVINGTWQETTTTNTDYHTTFDLDDTLESIWYDGKELYTFEIPRKDFNRPFIANLIYSHKFPYGLTFTNFVKYRGAYWKLSRVPGETHPSSSNPGENINVYEKVKSHNVVTFDWHLNWKLPSLVKQNIVLSLDVLNVFNKRAKIGYQTGTLGYDYELGRQIWAGVEFNF